MRSNTELAGFLPALQFAVFTNIEVTSNLFRDSLEI